MEASKIEQIVEKKCSFKIAPKKVKNPDRTWHTWKFPNKVGPWNLTGYSRAADKTFLWIPELKISLDCGLCRGRQPENSFLTHTHTDHSKDVGWICQKETGMNLYCPIEATTFVDAYVRAEIALNSCEPFQEDKMKGYKESDKGTGRTLWKINGVKGGDSFDCEIRGTPWHIQVFQMYHSIPCVGYGFYQKKKKLKDQYKGLKPNQLKELREKGEQLEDIILHPAFAFMGDTSIKALQDQSILQFPVVIVECTFLDGGGGIKEKCERDGHIYWEQLEPIVLQNPQTTFVLIHFSLRFTTEEIVAYFQGLYKRQDNPLTEKQLENVVLFITPSTEGRDKEG